MPRTDDDDTPIRRHTRRPAPLWHNPVVWIAAGVLVTTFVVAVVAVSIGRGSSKQPSVSVRGHPVSGVPLLPGIEPMISGGHHKEGSHLLAYSKWWSNKATPAKIQTIVEDLTKNSGVTVFFNQDGDFTRSLSYSSSSVLRVYGMGDYYTLRFLHGVESEYQRVLLYATKNPDQFTVTSVIHSGKTQQLHRASNFGRLTIEESVRVIEDVLVGNHVDGSGKGLTVR